jgi:hypothetical protein
MHQVVQRYRLQTGCGRSTSPCAARTRLYKLIDAQNRALKSAKKFGKKFTNQKSSVRHAQSGEASPYVNFSIYQKKKLNFKANLLRLLSRAPFNLGVISLGVSLCLLKFRSPPETSKREITIRTESKCHHFSFG